MGVDLSTHTSNALDEYDPADYDAIVCVCGCTTLVPDSWKGDAYRDWDIDDPPELDPGDLSVYRRVRDELKVRVHDLYTGLAP